MHTSEFKLISYSNYNCVWYYESPVAALSSDIICITAFYWYIDFSTEHALLSADVN